MTMKLVDVLGKYNGLEPVAKFAERLDPLQLAKLNLILSETRVTINHRDSGNSGKAYCHSNNRVIELNYKIFTVERQNDLRSTLLHEVAHHINFFIYRGKGHDRNWKAIMIGLGRPPNRCHEYDYIERARREPKHIFTCKDCGHEYPTVKILKRWEDRYHPECRGKANRGHLSYRPAR